MQITLIFISTQMLTTECRSIKSAGIVTNVVSAASHMFSSRRVQNPSPPAAPAEPKASRLSRVAEGATAGSMAIASLGTLFSAVTGLGESKVVTPEVVSPFIFRNCPF